MKKLLIEICAGSVEDVIAAEVGGADRVELNSALMLGGLTPSSGALVEAKRLVNIPVMAMVRPRAGGFCYSTEEFNQMELDVQYSVEHNADGVVFGILHSTGEIDIERTKKLVKLCGDKQAVFHRAFDVVPDPFTALEQLIDIGVTRILTSGQECSCYNGAEMLRQLIEKAAGRIQILPGGGIDVFNLRDVIERTGTDQVHMALLSVKHDTSTSLHPQVFFGGELRPSEIEIMCTNSNDVSHAVRVAEILKM